MPNVKITGYWTFFCNPKYWAIDEFLVTIKSNFKGEFRITSWQKDYFEKGQLGVIRVGLDSRSKIQLNGKPKLERGIYAVVEITGTPQAQDKEKNTFKIDHQKDESRRFVVPIKYIKNYITSPVLLSELENDTIIKRDSYLMKGIQAASMPLPEEDFNRVLLYGENKDSTVV